ncbi:uncharacterized protein LOC127798664 [Diospyros lotus]|uniref:uncharacterized protein LOC127798664 n=1 Tax=Diospyros lotus TaxID=55363 RepID=UPI0022545CC4|nr:uncharacterized protein LOC127798664 [Diospyros lotus]XP_052188156.1 uncharacterized protein LOC127798664 [Diospyros lotus]XP_052188157.1 uncharacterized protein LOC127798664 [Diospyros lotus]
MDQSPPRDNGFAIDLEIGVANGEEVGSAGPSTKAGNTCFTSGCSGFVSVDGLITGEAVNLSDCGQTSTGVLLENVQLLIDKKAGGDEAADPMENKSGKERRKTTSAKKPPRPPKALSLDAADQKLMREIAELAMTKRAKVERMKALKKMKAAKASASTGNFLGMLFTLIFCLVIVFQGMCTGRKSTASFQGSGSPESARGADSGFISVHYLPNTSANDVSIRGSGSSSSVKPVLDSDPTGSGRKRA